MREGFIALVVFLVITSVFIAGCSSNVLTGNKLSSRTPSEMVLQLSDLPMDYKLQERSELAPDIDSYAHSEGWKKGYSVSFSFVNNDDKAISVSVISQQLSVYPIENIRHILPHTKVSLNNKACDEFVVDEMPNPNIGDFSQAFRFTDKNGKGTTRYFIEFVKMDVYVNLLMGGSVGSTDYELLKDIAKKAAAKIK